MRADNSEMAGGAVNTLPKSYRNANDRQRRLGYIADNRADINRGRREKYLANVPKVSARDLDLFREDPQREARLKLKYIVCRECGAKLDILKGKKGGHLWKLHKTTAEQYAEKWPGAPLVSNAFRDRKARGGRKPKPTLRGHSRPNLKIRGHIDGRPLKKSDLVPLLAQGLSYVEIGKRVNRHFTSIEDAVRRWNLRSFVRSLKDAPDLKEHLAPLSKAKVPGKPAHRPRKDEEAKQIDRLKTEGFSWRQIAIQRNRGKKKAEQRTPDAYRSLWRSRHPPSSFSKNHKGEASPFSSPG